MREKRKLAPSPTDMKDDLVARHGGRRSTDRNYSGGLGNPPGDPLSISASYFYLRAGLAALALAFPVMLILGGMIFSVSTEIEPSLSAYYHYHSPGSETYGAGSMRNVFVGVLWAIGAFLVLYRGFSWKEEVALDIAGVAAILIAICPMDWPVGRAVAAYTLTGATHYGSAIAFFVMIAFVCVRCSNDTLEILQNELHRKVLRRIYKALGIWMTATPFAIVAWHLISLFLLHTPYRYVILFVEIAGVWVFSIFWIVKTIELLLIEWE